MAHEKQSPQGSWGAPNSGGTPPGGSPLNRPLPPQGIPVAQPIPVASAGSQGAGANLPSQTPPSGTPIGGQPSAYPASPQGHPIPVGRLPAQPISAAPAQAYPPGSAIPKAQPIPSGVSPGGSQPAAPSVPRPIPARGLAPRAVPRPGSGRIPGGAPPSEEEQAEQEILDVAVRNAPPWLVSLVVHMLLLIILGLWLLPPIPRNIMTILVPRELWAEQLGEQLEFDTPLGVEMAETKEAPVLTPDNLIEVEDPFAAPTKLDNILPDGRTASSEEKVDHIGLALHGREIGMKKALVGLYGGNRLTQEAVALGLAWLARNQRKDGSWSLLGPYRDGATTKQDNPEAATGLALLAFLGDGHTHQKGKYKQNVQRGMAWLLDQQDQNGNFFHEGLHNHAFYTQGICTIALCELYAMTKDEKFREPAQRAIQYCLASQAPEGGWRYQPGIDSDVSVTGWVLMALQSARMAGMEIPPDHFRRVERFLDRSVARDGFRYCYQKGMEPSLAMTAEALLCRQYLGWPKDEPRMIEALEWMTHKDNLIDFSPGKRNLYYWYYATQVCHHMDRTSKYWKTWNAVMREAVPRAQVKKGPERGSWDPDLNDPFEAHGGRLYATCLCILMLEVYYRHLPIYAPVYSLLGSPRYQLP